MLSGGVELYKICMAVLAGGVTLDHFTVVTLTGGSIDVLHYANAQW